MKSVAHDTITRTLAGIVLCLCAAVMLVPVFVFGHGPHILGVGGINNDLDALRAK